MFFNYRYHQIAITCWDKPTYDQAGQPQPLYIPENQEIGNEYKDEQLEDRVYCAAIGDTTTPPLVE